MAQLDLTLDEAMRFRIFRPQPLRRFEAVLTDDRPMVHYSSAEAALSIITNRKIWLRNSAFMNDASEIKYGMDLLAKYFNSDNAERKFFWDSIDRRTGGRAAELQKLYDDWSVDLTSSTFICCVSEHDAREDLLGRLSMWRAYGRPHGVALVVNSGYLARDAAGLAAYSYPVEYPIEAEAFKLFAELEANILQFGEYLDRLSAQDVYDEMFTALQTFVLTIKHPGFAEEREWRVIHRPNFESSPLISPRTISINGAPQRVYELPLIKDKSRDLELDLNTLVRRVIIGPSTHALAMWRAFVDALQEAGVEKAEDKVWCSGLPLRA